MRIIISSLIMALLLNQASYSAKNEQEKNLIDKNVKILAEKSIKKGVDYLLSKQQKNGSWMHHPAMTALSAVAIANSSSKIDAKIAQATEKGLEFIRKHVQKDGSIWNKDEKNYPNYSTAVSLIALGFFNKPQDETIIRNARKFLMNSQFSDVSPDNPFYGGVGYGRSLRPDLSNTQWALEALYLTDHLDREPFAKEKGAAKKADLMWERAQKFLSRVQNLPQTNDQGWVASDPDNEGSFIYLPAEVEGNTMSKAGTYIYKGRKTLRGYGSMTYAGLKSMIYAKVDKNDPRVKAAFKWGMKNYSLKENPGMGQQGLYYYLHTMAKTFAVMGKTIVKDKNGKKHDWRKEMIARITVTQRTNGSWFNETARWWENIPELVTAYSLLTLEATIDRDLTKVIIPQKEEEK
ncbi:MAG: prenyltransferase/squalene oxidase repeat-containing protein [Verrucomicrobiota bacterium]|nr:prenyltransferase/squalene oxidase repeat-containing protein [Verrucomicrobiota bacterium]